MRQEWELRVESPGSALLVSPCVLRVVMSEVGAERLAGYYVNQERKAVAWGPARSSLPEWKFWYPDNICPTPYKNERFVDG